MALQVPGAVKVKILNFDFRLQPLGEPADALHPIRVGTGMIAGVDAMAEGFEQKSERAVGGSEIEDGLVSGEIGERKSGVAAELFDGEEVGKTIVGIPVLFSNGTLLGKLEGASKAKAASPRLLNRTGVPSAF